MIRAFAVFAFGFALTVAVHAQAPEGTLTDHEVETLRDAAYVPADHIKAYESILNDREKELETIMAKRHTVDFANDVHDVMEQIGNIADELNDHLDDYSKRHRDLRKIAPRLVQSTERWSSALRAPADDSRYDVVRKIALDSLKDTRELAETIETEQAAYFKEHPEAAKAEKDRAANPHAPQ